MTTSKNERLKKSLHRILSAALLAESYVEGLSKEDFLKDSKTQDAVCMNIVVLGENSAKLLELHGEELSVG